MKVGKLEKIDIRNLWKEEPSDFTPWLAKEENIKLLSETIGIELEVIEQEKNVGPFRADILCKNTIDEHFVLIENQLEKTDHSHLGQIMTYAAGLDAVTIIWIAKQFTEEHRATVDWLNRITNEQFNFFGIEIEVFKIGDSLPAPLFQMISKPNEWSKIVKSAASTQNLTDTKALNLEYWSQMKQYLNDNNTFLKQQKPLPQHWTDFALGRSSFHLSAVSSVRDNFIRIDFILRSDTAKDDFAKLKEKYEQSSYDEISGELIWDELPDRKGSLIYLKKEAPVSDKEDWDNQHQWFMENIEKFDNFFRDKIKKI